MKPGPYFVVLLLGVACAVLAVTLIVVAQSNQKLQIKLQSQQQALSQGILGQQAQQISSGVLQDLANAAAGGNTEVRQLLEKYGYNVPVQRPQPAAPGASEKKQEDEKDQKAGTQTEAPKP